MIKSLFIVGIGSFMGGALRYLLSSWMKNSCTQGFPWGTLMVNLLGCFVIGVIFALFSRYSTTSNPWCLLLTTGLCGGFTTFSTFADDIYLLISQKHWLTMGVYFSLSVILGVLLVMAGRMMIKSA